jgi:hypothetical protein
MHDAKRGRVWIAGVKEEQKGKWPWTRKDEQKSEFEYIFFKNLQQPGARAKRPTYDSNAYSYLSSTLWHITGSAFQSSFYFDGEFIHKEEGHVYV